MIKIAIAEDYSLIRQAFAVFLSQNEEIDVVMEAADGRELLNCLKKAQVLPDVILMDIRMPVMDGREATQQIKKLHPDIHIIALSVFDHTHLIGEMFSYGASGFVTKDCNGHILMKAIYTVVNGNRFIYDGIAERIEQCCNNVLKNHVTLTDKQLEFLRYCASDLTYKEIADKMGISHRTIDRYRDDLFEKLNIKCRAGLVLFAVENGLN